MLPLIGLAATIVPELIRLIAGDKAGTLATNVSHAVTELTGTDDPVAARQKLAADATASATLQQRLAEIALEATKAQLASDAQTRQDELAAIKAADENTAGARGAMQALASGSSPIAWGAPVVSVVVTTGFFVVLALLVLSGLRSTDDKTVDIVNIAVGVLGTGFATVVNFWLGSSSGSRNKDAQVLALQADHATQSVAMLKTLQGAHDLHSQSTRSAFTAVQDIVTTALGRDRVPMPPPGPAAGAEPPADKFERCVAVTLAQEGGFVESADDPGGATNFGITRQTLQFWRGAEVSVDDVRGLNRAEAIEIYRSNYWLPTRCNDLGPGIDLMVFDCGVNAGPRVSVKLLQSVAGVTADGVLGPRTLAAIQAGIRATLIRQLADARLDYCRTLPQFPVFGAGWTSRVHQVMAAALAMA